MFSFHRKYEAAPSDQSGASPSKWDTLTNIPPVNDTNNSASPERRAETNHNQTFANISSDLHESRILAQMTGLGFNNPDKITSASIDAFRAKYPTPESFDEMGNDFLARIEYGGNPPKKYQEYILSMRQFKYDIYGDAEAAYEESKDQKAAELADKYFESATIDGDPFFQQGKKYTLTPEMLYNSGLGPRHEVSMPGVEIGLSDAFIVGDRPACIAYVKTEQGTKIRSYYRSNSASLWRYLPDYVQDENGNMEWYGKSYNEDAVTLPGVLQKELSSISKAPKVDIGNINPEFFLAGTGKRYTSKAEYKECLESHTLRGDFYDEVRPVASLDLSNHTEFKDPPESLTLAEPLQPNFTAKTDEFTFFTSVYGEVYAEEYSSNDGNFTYTFNRTYEKGYPETWIGQIEMNTPITSTGCRSEWVNSGNFTTPLYEYPGQTGGYGDQSDAKGKYISTWKNYLSKSPLILKFLSHLYQK